MKRLAWGTAALVLPSLSCTGGDDGDDSATTMPTTTFATDTSDDDDDDDDDDSTEGGTMDTTAGDDDDDDDDDTGGALCGNGQLDEGEGCDEPNGEDADGCNEDCTVSGAILWEHTQASGLGTEELFAVTVDEDGTAYVTGTFNNDELGGTDLWIRQYTADGGLGWTVSLNGSDNATDGGRDIARFGNAVYVAGFRDDGNNDWRVSEYTAAGAAGWTAGFNGGFGSDVAEGIATDLAGNVFVAGRMATEFTSQNIMVRQYTPGGAAGWTATAGGAGDDRALAVATDPMGNVIAVGYTAGTGRDVWVRKYDPAGTALWTQGYAGVDGLDDQAEAVATDAMGNIVVAGIETTTLVADTLWMRRYDPDGMELWTESYDGETGEGARGFGVAIDSVGHIVVVGDELVAGTRDALVRKYNPDATLRWSETYATATDAGQLIRGVTIGPGDRIWIAGGLNLGIDGRDAWVARIAQ